MMFKVTHTVYFSSSLYIINQKPMIYRTDFIVYPHGLHALLGEIQQSICLFLVFMFTSQMALLFNINFYFDCKIRPCLIVPGRHEKYISAPESFYLQGILDDINEQDTSFLDCKHKHMMKSRAPPDKFRVLYCMLTYGIPWFHKQN